MTLLAVITFSVATRSESRTSLTKKPTTFSRDWLGIGQKFDQCSVWILFAFSQKSCMHRQLTGNINESQGHLVSLAPNRTPVQSLIYKDTASCGQSDSTTTLCTINPAWFDWGICLRVIYLPLCDSSISERLHSSELKRTSSDCFKCERET